MQEKVHCERCGRYQTLKELKKSEFGLICKQCKKYIDGKWIKKRRV